MTSGDILTRVNQITKRSLTASEFEDLLYEALLRISRRTCDLKTSVTGTLSSTNYIDKPSDFVKVDSLVVDTNFVLEPITFDEYLRDRVHGYVVKGDKIYYRYESDTEDYTLYYSYEHPSDLTTILLGEKYSRAIYHLCSALVYEDYEIYDRMEEQLVLYEREMKWLSMDDDDAPPIVKPHTIETCLNYNQKGYKS